MLESERINFGFNFLFWGFRAPQTVAPGSIVGRDKFPG